MLRGDCEREILKKVLEIRDIYRQYVPGGECLEMRIFRGTNGADWGNWKTNEIEITNNTFQNTMPDGYYGAYENHMPLELRYREDDITDPVYIKSKQKFDEKYGEGSWDKEDIAEANSQDEKFTWHNKGMICSNDNGHYRYECWLKEHNIEPLYDQDRDIDIRNMEISQSSTWKE